MLVLLLENGGLILLIAALAGEVGDCGGRLGIVHVWVKHLELYLGQLVNEGILLQGVISVPRLLLPAAACLMSKLWRIGSFTTLFGLTVFGSLVIFSDLIIAHHPFGKALTCREGLLFFGLVLLYLWSISIRSRIIKRRFVRKLALSWGVLA